MRVGRALTHPAHPPRAAPTQPVISPSPSRSTSPSSDCRVAGHGRSPPPRPAPPPRTSRPVGPTAAQQLRTASRRCAARRLPVAHSAAFGQRLSGCSVLLLSEPMLIPPPLPSANGTATATAEATVAVAIGTSTATRSTVVAVMVGTGTWWTGGPTAPRRPREHFEGTLSIGFSRSQFYFLIINVP